MLPALNSIIDILSSRPNKFADPTEEARFLQYTVFVVTAMFIMVGFGLFHLFEGHYILGLALLCCLVGLCWGWVWLYKGNPQLPVYRLNVCVYSALLIYAMFIDGKEHSLVLWMYTAPLISFYLLGRRGGWKSSATLGCVAAIYFFLPVTWLRHTTFTIDFSIRFLTTYTLISVFTYFYENFRYRNKVLIVTQNKRLQEEIETRQEIEETLKESEARYRAIYEEAAEGILLADHEGNIVHCNPQFTRMFGYQEKEIMGHNLFSYFDANDLRRLPPQIKRLKDGESILVERRVQTKQGDYLLCEQSGKRVNEQLIILLYRDITERKNAEKAQEEMNKTLASLANLDGLTQIANRRMFDLSLDKEWRRMLREQKPLGLIIADIDYFKQYNDRYGHQKGDDCLKKVARVLQAAARRPADLVARYGGEEFTILLPNTGKEGCDIVAREMRKAVVDLDEVHDGSPRYHIVTMSFGTASIIPSPDSSAEDLLFLADGALYQAKDGGRNRVVSSSSLPLLE